MMESLQDRLLMCPGYLSWMLQGVAILRRSLYFSEARPFRLSVTSRLAEVRSPAICPERDQSSSRLIYLRHS